MMAYSQDRPWITDWLGVRLSKHPTDQLFDSTSSMLTRHSALHCVVAMLGTASERDRSRSARLGHYQTHGAVPGKHEKGASPP